MKDLASVSNVKKKDIARSYRLLLKEMDFKTPVVDPTVHIKDSLKSRISEKTQRRAREILMKAEQMRISAGKAPMGLAASALYMACILEGEDKSQRDVAEASGVMEVTIRNRYKDLRLALDI